MLDSLTASQLSLSNVIAFWEPVVAPLLEARAPDVVVEIGVLGGGTTVKLLDFAEAHDVVVHAIDPAPADNGLIEDLRRRHEPRFIFHREKSLDALPRIDEPHVVLIDGDHNWYTVLGELRVLAARAAEHGWRFPLTFLHDVDWPYGRRDSYYDPDAIPAEHRQAFRRGGLVYGESELSPERGINIAAKNATEEGTPRNGVRTAVEDFLAETDLDLVFKSVTGYNGLGIIVAREDLDGNGRLRAAVAELESPEWLSRHCRRLEEARIHHLIESSELRRAMRALERGDTA